MTGHGNTKVELESNLRDSFGEGCLEDMWPFELKNIYTRGTLN